MTEILNRFKQEQLKININKKEFEELYEEILKEQSKFNIDTYKPKYGIFTDKCPSCSAKLHSHKESYDDHVKYIYSCSKCGYKFAVRRDYVDVLS